MDSRELFETYFRGSRKNKGVEARARLLRRREDDTYEDDSTQRHWWTWQQAQAALIVERDRAVRTCVIFSDVIENHTHAMQAAVIERYAGGGAEAGMDWIQNTLAGPGLMPDLDAAVALLDAKTKGPAQAWFDMQEERHAAFRAANPGPAAPGNGGSHG